MQKRLDLPRSARHVFRLATLLGLTAAAAATLASRAPAASYTWNGGGASNIWSDAGNWSGGVPASSADTALTFAGTKGLTNTHNLANPFQLNSLSFASNAGAFIIGGNGLNFTNSSTGTGPALNQNSANGVALANALTLTNNLTLGGSGAGSVTLSGQLSGAGGLMTSNTATTLSLTGGSTAAPSALGFLQINGNTKVVLSTNGGVLNLSATGSTGFGGNSSLFVEGGARFVLQQGSTLNTVATPQIHNSGAITVQDSSVWTNTGTGNEIRVGYAGGTSSLTVTGGGTLNTGGLRLGHNFASNQGHGSLTITNSGTVNAATLTLDDTSGAAIRVSESSSLTVGAFNELQAGTVVTLGNSGTLTANVSAATGTTAFGGTLQDEAQSGIGFLTKAGTGTLVLTGTSSGFSGNVNLNAGNLGAGNNAALGTGTVNAGGGALYASRADRILTNPFSVASGQTLNLVSVSTDLHNLTLNGGISGAGGLTVNAPGGTVTLGNSTSNSYSGLTSVTAGTLLLNDSGGPNSGDRRAVGGNLSVGNSGANPAAGTPAAAVVRFLNDDQTSAFLYSGSGALTIYADGLLDLNGHRSDAPSLTMTGGELRLSGGNFTLSGGVTINASANGSLISSGNGTLDLNRQTTFTVADGTATYDLDYQPTVYNGTLVKAGPGLMRLSGGGFLGAVTLNAGTLALASNNALADNGVTITGGTVIADGADRTLGNSISVTGSAAIGSSVDGTPRSLTFTGATSLGANTTLTVSNNATTTFSGVVSGAGSLLKTGNGTLALTNTGNTFTGGLTLNGGTLNIAADGSLGAAGNVVTLNTGTLQYTASATTARTFLLANAVTLSPGAGNTLTYGGGASVNGGFLGASGTHAFADGSSLNGTTTALGSTVTAAGAVSFANATVRGTLTQTGGTLSVADTVVSSAGTLTVNGTTNTNGLEMDGILSVNTGGTVSNSGTALVLGGGSRTTINAGGTLATASGTTVELDGALLTNNGTLRGTVNVNYGSTLKGSGSAGSINVTDGGRFGVNAPSTGMTINSGLSAIHLTGTGGLTATAFVGPQLSATPATATLASLALGSGSVFAFSVQDAQGVAGVGYDTAHANGTLTLAAGTAAGSQITISVASLNGGGTMGQASNFDPSHNYSFVLMSADGGISGYNPAEFVVDTSAFQNATQGGSFSVVQAGNNLDLVFTSAVPEPGTWTILILGVGLLGLRLRRQTRGS